MNNAFIAGRLKARQYGVRDGDKLVIEQMHRNGSREVVGEIELHGDEIEDALYILGRAKAARAIAK